MVDLFGHMTKQAQDGVESLMTLLLVAAIIVVVFCALIALKIGQYLFRNHDSNKDATQEED